MDAFKVALGAIYKIKIRKKILQFPRSPLGIGP
jgi:hypothetical protein